MAHPYTRCLITFVFILVTCGGLLAQDILIGSGNVNTCTGTFYDSGGPNGNHAGTPQEITICSSAAGTAQSHVRLLFTALDIAGAIRVFNGPNTSAPERTPVTDTGGATGFTVTATAGNPSGCLTLLFEPNGDPPGAGWAATISCVRSCQDITGSVTTQPAAQPAVDGFVDVCPGDEITFMATPDFPENNVNYAQAAATANFEWSFQDGTVASGTGLTSVTHTFDEPGGYIVQVVITDDQGCRNTTPIVQRVRVAPPPRFGEPDISLSAICANQEVSITIGRPGATSDIILDATTIPFSYNTSQTLAELVYLPDGNGDVYESPIVFTNFLPGQTLSSPGDLIRICATMEHSYLGDLDIFLECPDGREVFMHRYDDDDEVQRQLLGLGTNDTDENDPPDPFGTYCWTATAPRTMQQTVIQDNIGDDETVPSGDYRSEQSFASLVGCPLNGEWKLKIRDNIPQDNGSIGSWTLEFADFLYPEQDTFQVALTDLRILPDNNFTSYNIDSVTFLAPNAGPNGISIEATDEYGCRYDTAVIIDVLPPYHPGCFTCGPLVDRPTLDTAVCLGASFTPNVVGSSQDTAITFESTGAVDFGNALYPNRPGAYISGIAVADFVPDRIVSVAEDFVSVCVNLENNGNLSDVILQLISPNNEVITLLRDFGGNGEDLVQTCFSPTATQPLSTGTAPYTGTWQSIGGNWPSFNNAPINGEWTVRAFDRAGNDLGRFVSWSVAFRYQNQPTYAWTPNDGTLSCTDCPNPSIEPMGDATYTVLVTDANGCTDQATVNVTLETLDASFSHTVTEPACGGEASGTVDLTVTGPDGPYTFRWSNGATTEDLTGVPSGAYVVTVSNAAGCREVYEVELNEPDPLILSLDEVVNVSCFGGSDGQVLVSTTGGVAPVTYRWNDPNVQVDEDAGALTARAYRLVATDANGCTDTLNVDVGQPDPLAVTFRSQDVACRGGADGYAVAVATGGNGDYAYAWQTGSSQDSVPGLAAGPYEVTVTDPLGCSVTASVTLDQPAEALTATTVQDEQGCFEASANRATVTAAGGRGGYQYAWGNGEVTATAVALPAGQNLITVTDAGGCPVVDTIELEDLPAVTVNIIAVLPSCNDTDDGRLGVIPGGGAGSSEADYTYLWSTGATELAINDLPGNRLYAVTVTDTVGCTGQGERFLAAPPPITFDLDETPVDCSGNSTGALRINNLDGPNPGDFFLQWGPGAGNSTSTTVSGLAAGDYALAISDVDGCNLDTLLTVTSPPPLGASFERRDVSCFGDTDGSIVVQGTGGVGNYRYAWDTGSNQTQLAGLAAGTYALTVSDGNDCTFREEVTIVQPAAVGLSAAADPVVCRGDATGGIILTANGGRPPYLYGLEGQGFTRNDVFIGLPAGDYVAFVRDSSGCEISTVVLVEDGPEFTVELPEDEQIVFGDSLVLNPTTTGGVGVVNYEWRGSYPGTLSCTDCEEPLATPEFEIDYSVAVTDANGCRDEDRFRVSVRKIREVFVPTGFTPNDDGMNDRLIVHGRPGTQVVEFIVFDRWTNEVYVGEEFPVNDVDAAWDGTYKGTPLPADVYLYRVIVRYDDDSEETLSGQTTLVR